MLAVSHAKKQERKHQVILLKRTYKNYDNLVKEELKI